MNKKVLPCALLINDIHVSKDSIEDFHANWGEAISICQEKNISDIIVGGDLWLSRSSQTLDVLLAVRQAILKATSLGIEVTIAEGNHDKVDQESVLGYSHMFSEYPKVNIVDTYLAYEYGDDVVLYTMSYFPENGSFIDKLNDILENDFDSKKHNILYMHEGVNGALANSSDKELPAHIFKDFDAVLVGHYHDRIKIKGTNVEYIGSSRQHNFGEDEQKGYTILYKDGSYEFVQNQANTRYTTIELSPKEIEKESSIDKIKGLKDAGYKVKVRVPCESADTIDIDRKMLSDIGVSKVEVVKQKIDVKVANNYDLDQKYDKEGIKEEYKSFCLDEAIPSELGVTYLDKI